MLKQRNKYLSAIKESVEQVPITVLIGARQVGKTSLIKTLKTELEKVILDGQLPEIIELFANYENVIEYLRIKLNENLAGLLIIDEFQFIPGISRILKILVDKYSHLKIICTGSSSLDIIQRIEESLAGRVRYINVYSLSLSESLMFIDEKLSDEYEKYSTSTQYPVIASEIKKIFSEYLIYGGMPKIWHYRNPKDKIKILDDIYKTYLLRDVKSYVRQSDSVGFNKLLRLLALQTSNLLNVNALSRETGLDYRKCEDYLYLLEQMFIIKLIEPYSTNVRKSIKKMKKIFFLDLGIRNLISRNFNSLENRTDAGALIENFVFLEILKKIENYYSLNFFRTRDGAEIDFIVDTMFERISIEVKKKSMKKPVNYKSLLNFNSLENIEKSYILNKTLTAEKDKITFLPYILTEKIFVNILAQK